MSEECTHDGEMLIRELIAFKKLADGEKQNKDQQVQLTRLGDAVACFHV